MKPPFSRCRHFLAAGAAGVAVFAVEYATGLVSGDLTKFVARQVPLQDQLISNGTGLAYCPIAPEFLAIVTADVNHPGLGLAVCVSGGATLA